MKIIKESEPFGKVFAKEYLQTIAYFAPVIIVCFIALGIIRGSGDTRYALVVNGIIIFVNVVLDPILMFGRFGFPRMEAAGLAIAKGSAFSIGLVLTVLLLRSRKCSLFLSFRELTTPKWESVKILFKNGFPTTIEQLTWSTGQFIVSLYAARLGIVVLTTHQILLMIQTIISMCYQGFSLGSMTLVGKNVGADQHREAEKTGLYAGLVMLCLALGIIWGINIYWEQILHTFTNNHDIISLGVKIIVIFSLVQIPKALNAVITGNLRGAGELKWIMWLTIVSVLLFEISASWAMVFIFQFALAGIWMMQGFDEASRLIFNYIRFRKGKWKLQNI